MLRGAAAFLVALSASGAGYLYSMRLALRVKKLEKILLFISQIKTEIEFTADSVSGIFASVSSGNDLSLLPFVALCLEKMSGGEDFSTAWNGALDEKESVRALKNEDVALLRSFGSSLGATDCGGQMRNCEMHSRLFRERLNCAVEDKKRLYKPTRAGGLLTGAALLIILL